MKGETDKGDLFNDMDHGDAGGSSDPWSFEIGQADDASFNASARGARSYEGDYDTGSRSQTASSSSFWYDEDGFDEAKFDAESGGAEEIPPMPEPEPAPKSRSWWKILLGLGVGCLSVNLILGVIALSAMTLGVASCSRSCSDRPVGDSEEASSFIASLDANDRDLATFDALAGSIQALYESQVEQAEDGAEAERIYSPSQLRSAIEAGAWPEGSGGYGGTEGSLDPRVWVRIAELSQDHLEQTTGEKWEVIDFSYPFPDNGPIPVPPRRDEYDSTCTRLRCIEGEDLGLYAEVDYYRWAKEAHFEDNTDMCRDKAVDARRQLEQMSTWKELEGRRWILSTGDLFIWCTGADDELCQPERFVEAANALTARLDSYSEVVLLAADAPVMLSYSSLSYDYPNKMPVEELELEDAQERLVQARYFYIFDSAYGDRLLQAYRSGEGEPVTLDDLRGALSQDQWYPMTASWFGPTSEGRFNDDLAQAVAQAWDMDAKDLVALVETDSYEDDISLDVWLLVKRGQLPETPRAFCDSANSIIDVVWTTMRMPESQESARCDIRVYVLEPQMQDPKGNACDFAAFREAMRTDPTTMGSYKVDVALLARPGARLWPDSEDGRYNSTVERDDISGTIAASREWRYGTANDEEEVAAQ